MIDVDDVLRAAMLELKTKLGSVESANHFQLVAAVTKHLVEAMNVALKEVCWRLEDDIESLRRDTQAGK